MPSSAIGKLKKALQRGRRSWRFPLPTKLSLIPLRQWTVLAMITFAVLGAATAYRGARTEQEAISLAEILAQGQLIEVGERQRLRTQTVAATALRIRMSEVFAEGQELTRKAALARQESRPNDAAWLTMRSHEEFAAARAIRLIKDGFAADRMSPDEEHLRVAGTLADLGFGTFVHLQLEKSSDTAANHSEDGHCDQSNAIELSRIWCETRVRLETLHEHVRTSALAVAGFVLALTLFTVSDASAKARWPILKWSFLGTGLLTGVGAIAVALVWGDITAWPWLLGGLVATPVIWLGLHYACAFAEQRGWVHTERIEGSVHSEEVAFERAALRAPVLGHHIDHRFGIVTIILIAVTVFVSASVGWGYSVANTHADSAAEEARKSAADMVIRTALYSSRQTEVVRALTSAAESRIRLGLASQRIQLSNFSGSIRGKYGDEDARHSDSVRNSKGQFRDIDWAMDSDNLSVEHDPQYPNRLVWQFLRIPALDVPPTDAASRREKANDEREERSRNSFEAFAQWGFESGLSVSWRNVATKLLAALTIFAICLYFLGQALAMEPTRSGYVLLTAGTIFGCFGLASSLVALYPMTGLVAQPASKAVDAVLTDNRCPAFYSDFAKGSARSKELAAYFYGVGMVLSTYDSDASDLERAKIYFSCALALNEGFGHAKLRLARVKNTLGSLDISEEYQTLPTREKLQEIDLAQAQTLLRQSGLNLSASDRNSLAFDATMNGLIRRDEEALILAESVAGETVGLVKQGKLLARPRTTVLLDLNLGMVRLARGDFVAARHSYEDAQKAASDSIRLSILTDLEIVGALRCNNKDEVNTSKFDCVGLGRATAEIKKILLTKKTGDGRQITLRQKEDFTVSATANYLSARVRNFDFKTDDVWVVWSRMESDWNSWRTLQAISRPMELSRPGEDHENIRRGTVEVKRSFMASYPAIGECLGEGRYRAELYSHGTLIATRYLDRRAQGMKAVRARELNLQLCMPAGWTIGTEKASTAEQRGNYGLARILKNSAGEPVAFLMNFYLPPSSDGLTSCLLPKNAINCAVGSLRGVKLITGNEPLVNFEDHAVPNSIEGANLYYRTWTAPDGGVHIIVAKAGAAPAAQLWNMLESAETIYAENDMKLPPEK